MTGINFKSEIISRHNMYRLGWIILLLFFYIKHIRYNEYEYTVDRFDNHLTRDLIWKI